MTVHDTPASHQKMTYKPAEVALLIGLGKQSVYALIRSGQIRNIRVGRKILIPTSAIAEFLAGRQE